MLGSGSSSEVLFNSRVVGAFEVRRSIKQGCPLAPLLFAASTHPFIALLEQAASEGLIQGLQMCNDEQLIIKMFADDSMLFLKAEADNVRKALEIVQTFGVASGQNAILRNQG